MKNKDRAVYFVSVILICFSVNIIFKSLNSKNGYHYKANEEINGSKLKELLAENSIEIKNDKPLVIIYLINNQYCVPCIHEYVEYDRLIDNLFSDLINPIKVTIVMGDDFLKTKRYISTISLPNMIPMDLQSLLVQKLYRYKNGNHDRQIIFIDLLKDKITFRIQVNQFAFLKQMKKRGYFCVS